MSRDKMFLREFSAMRAWATKDREKQRKAKRRRNAVVAAGIVIAVLWALLT